MKAIVGLIVLLAYGKTCDLQGANSSIPGLAFHSPPQTLAGKLAFHLHHDAESETNGATAGAIFEFDLARNRLRKVTDSPTGVFFASRNGDAVCVVYRPGHRFQSDPTNVFVYSHQLERSTIFQLPVQPQRTVFAGGNILFEIEIGRHTRIRGVEIGSAREFLIELPDASQWEYQVYDRIHAPRALTNVIHFTYRGFGKPLGEGRNYKRGVYSWNAQTGDIQWVADSTEDRDDEAFYFRTYDDRYIFFEGRDAPIHGFKLVSAPWDDFEHGYKDGRGKAKEVKTVTTFSRTAAMGGGIYTLDQISPCGRYALVRFSEGTRRKTGMLPGTVHTYYIVDVDTGEKHLLLKDEIQKQTKGFLSQVWWVKNGEAMP
jgi:hypothetical protein